MSITWPFISYPSFLRMWPFKDYHCDSGCNTLLPSFWKLGLHPGVSQNGVTLGTFQDQIMMCVRESGEVDACLYYSNLTMIITYSLLVRWILSILHASKYPKTWESQCYSLLRSCRISSINSSSLSQSPSSNSDHGFPLYPPLCYAICRFPLS